MAPVNLMTPVNLMEIGNTMYDIVTKKRNSAAPLRYRFRSRTQMNHGDPVYLLWRRVRCPFALPEKCHRCRMDDWEVFDVDKAGCRVCGRFHLCSDGGECPGVVEVSSLLLF